MRTIWPLLGTARVTPGIFRPWFILLMVAIAAAGFGLSYLVSPGPHEAEERALCDRSVNALLTSPDLVEVTRAGIIVRTLNCGIGRRLDGVTPAR